jgi:hypothetical protein
MPRLLAPNLSAQEDVGLGAQHIGLAHGIEFGGQGHARVAGIPHRHEAGSGWGRLHQPGRQIALHELLRQWAGRGPRMLQARLSHGHSAAGEGLRGRGAAHRRWWSDLTALESKGEGWRPNTKVRRHAAMRGEAEERQRSKWASH